AQYIAQHPELRDESDSVVELLKAWKDNDQNENERKRVSEAMHQSPLWKEQYKADRRALILLRTAILRHDASKAKTDINGASNDLLASLLYQTVGQCLTFSDQVPPWLLLSRYRKEEQRYLSRLQDLNKNWENEIDSLKASVQTVYDKYTASKMGRRGFQLDRINTRTIKYVPVPTDMDNAVKVNLAFLDDADETVEKGQAG